MNALTLVAMIAIGQVNFSNPPAPTDRPSPPVVMAYHWAQLPDGTVRQVWGWKDTAGMIHPVPYEAQSQAAGAQLEQTGAVNYGVNVKAIAQDGMGTTVRASSAEAEATAFDLAGKDCPPEGCKIRPPDLMWGVEQEIRQMVVLVLCVVVALVAVVVAVRRKK